MQNVTLNVQGMSCNSCVNKVGGSIRKLEGIEEVQVKVADGQVTVVYDEAQVAIEKIVEAIEGHGYAVVK